MFVRPLVPSNVRRTGRSLRATLRFVFVALVTTNLAACLSEPVEPGAVTRNGDQVQGTGTIVHFRFEGGFFAIRGDDGVTYDPLNLAEQYERHGLRVRFTAKLRTDVGSFHLAGPMVEILEIDRL